jgi:hypothetical protein
LGGCVLLKQRLQGNGAIGPGFLPFFGRMRAVELLRGAALD